MQPEDLQERWKEQGEETFASVAQWRAAHPQATLAEIEQAVDEQMNRLRARMIEQAAQASAAAESEAREATGV
jgi:DNA-binding transcriptional regulator WhiA